MQRRSVMTDSATAFSVALAHHEAGRLQQAEIIYHDILASDPDHAATNSLMAEYYSKRPNDAGLANFYRLRAAPVPRAPR